MACAPNKSRPVSLTFHLIRVPPPTHPSSQFALLPPFSPIQRPGPTLSDQHSELWLIQFSLYLLSLSSPVSLAQVFSLILIRKFLLGGGLALVTNPGPQPSTSQLPNSCSTSAPLSCTSSLQDWAGKMDKQTHRWGSPALPPPQFSGRPVSQFVPVGTGPSLSSSPSPHTLLLWGSCPARRGGKEP